jgi:hemerythrin-like domain-containing protein
MHVHPTEQLRQEHELVRMVARAMEREVGYIERTGTVRRVRIARMVDFSAHFTDDCHHHKEEDLLFPVLREREAGVDAVIGTMLSEHRMGRAAVRAVDGALMDADWDRSACETVAVNLGVYAELLRLHMAKEELVLFPLAEKLLSDHEMELLAEDFEGFESRETGRGEHERYESLARDLARGADRVDDVGGAGGRLAA